LHPLFRSEDDQVWAGLIAEHRSSKTSVLGEDFCFEPQTASCDDPTVSVLRQSLEWTRATRADVFALRSLLSVGVEALDATTHGKASVPDGRYLVWLGQAQWVHVLPERLWGTQTLLRVDTQISNDPLLSIERFAIGGLDSVRGYRENQLVRDSGVVVSGELRIPVWRDSLRRSLLELVPFTDYGYGWNDGFEPPDDTLWSLGAGLRFTPWRWLLAEIYWGGRLRDVPNPNDDLQDEGVSFRVVVDVF
jgi:hemolysin activation/secretion protein